MGRVENCIESVERGECPVRLNCSLPGPHGRKSEVEEGEFGWQLPPLKGGHGGRQALLAKGAKGHESVANIEHLNDKRQQQQQSDNNNKCDAHLNFN